VNQSYLDHPVFICGHRKTGTTLLANLFDGAEDAVVIPDDSTFFYMYHPRYTSDQYTDEEKKNRLANVLIGDINGEKIGKAKCTEDERKNLYEKNEFFKRSILEYKGDDYSLKGVLTRFVKGYNDSFLKLKDPKVWIEKTTSTEIYALEVAEIFPNAKFIHIIRDPRDNWASLSSGWNQRYQHFNDDVRRLKQSLLERGKLGLEMAKYNQETIGTDRYKVLKFEDLTANPQNNLKLLAEYIGIDYNNNLLYPSTFGFRWDGNNFDGIKHQGPSAVNVNKWKDRISENDARLIEFHFRDIMDYFDYKRVYSLHESQKEAIAHYKWFNFASPYSAK
jgi:hypothetical protein